MNRKILGFATALLLSVSGMAAYSQSPPPASATKNGGNQAQPQGETGPINTKSGGAPAASPQGETPPGMQSAPQGSNETVKTETSGETVGAPKK
jgi:hypothetical protein